MENYDPNGTNQDPNPVNGMNQGANPADGVNQGPNPADGVNQGPNPADARQTYDNQQKGKGFSLTSMVTGIVSVCTCCIWYFCIPLGVVSLVFGIISLMKKYEGRNMALAGVITGGAGLLLCVLALVFMVFVGFFGMSMAEIRMGH